MLTVKRLTDLWSLTDCDVMLDESNASQRHARDRRFQRHLDRRFVGRRTGFRSAARSCAKVRLKDRTEVQVGGADDVLRLG